MTGSRTTLRRLVLLAITGVPAAAGLTGCTSQGSLDRLRDANTSLTNRNVELTEEIEALEATLADLRNNRGAASATAGQLGEENRQLRQQLQQALADMRALEARLADLPLGGLNPATDAALERLAAQYPGLITYDSERGMLRFASDLTFASGSAEVQPQAREALNALTRILQAEEAQEYETIVVGHTDSQRLSTNTRQRFGSNRGLSTARAISVIGELETSGVPGSKMQAAGWGEYRPLVPNTPTGNTPQNRRVEIFLRPSTYGLPGGPAAVPAPDVAPRQGGSIGIDREAGGAGRFEPTK